MREIKFRGRDLNGKWRYGNYQKKLLYSKDSKGEITKKADWVQYITSFEYVLNGVPVDSVGQYTGLMDKHGNEIYEWDIVENVTQRVYLGHRFKVVWNVPYANFMLIRKDNKTSNIPISESDCFKVIGNIFENPELLEEST